MPLIFGVDASGILRSIRVDTDGDLRVQLEAGSNNIGDVDVLTLPTLNIASLPALPAGANEIGLIQARNYGWLGAAWQKDPLRVGYSGGVRQGYQNLELAGGSEGITLFTVPAGEAWWIQNISLAYTGTLPTNIYIYVPNPYVIYQLRGASMTSGVYVQIPGGPWLAEPGDAIRVHLGNSTWKDDLNVDLTGMRIDTDQ